MKIDTKDIAEKIKARGLESSDKHIEDTITEMLLNQINPQLETWTEQVLEKLQELEHSEPRTKAEYNERYGMDKE